MLRIEITPLKTGIHEVLLEPEPETIELDPETFRDIRVEARLDVHEQRILVMLRAEATARLECDRTLQLFDQRLEGHHSVLFAPRERVAGDDEAYAEVRPFEPGDQEIEVGDVVRDTLLLAVPQRCIAPGAEDIDIQTEFGRPAGEDAIDPRWEALRGLRSGGEER